METSSAKPAESRLQELETILTQARHWATEEAKALREIRDKKLYKSTHETFEQYGAERWGYQRTHLYRICGWGEVLEAISPIGCAPPMRESHARPLVGLPVDQQRAIWRDVEKRLGDSKTAEGIEAVAEAHLVRTKPQKSSETVQQADGQVICGDAFEMVKELTTKSVGLVVFSPPYCMQRADEYPSIPEAEFPTWMARLLDAMKSSLKDDTSVMIVGREHVKDGEMTDAWLRSRLAIREIGFKEIDTLIWYSPDKPPLGNPNHPRRTYEFVYWFSPTTKPYVDTKACGTPLKEPRKRMARPRGKELFGTTAFKRFGNSDTARVTDIITASVGGNANGVTHPAPFPPALAEQLIRTYSREGDLVIDPCCGSGTTLVAAKGAGRAYWGCDIVPEYVEASRQRLGKQI